MVGAMKLTAVVSVLGFYGAVFAADVSGKVSFGGAAPKSQPIQMKADPVCAKLNTGKTIEKEDLVVNANKTLANVFVYVKEGVKKESIPPVPTEPVTFDQRGCMYHPHVLGVRVGQPLKIINSDATLHNVNANAKVNSKFNQGMPTQGQTIDKKFTKPETMVRVKCDVHGWMNASIGVLDHPYFAVTDTTGGFTIKNLPAGEYTLEAWHEKLGTKTMKVTVAATAQPADFTF